MDTKTATKVPRVARNKSRDGFLDTIRAVATIRVILWHAFGTPFLSFLVASMPTMFFVAGSLLAASLNRRSYRTVVRDRIRRLLIPFWVFGSFVFAVFAISGSVAHAPSASFKMSNILGWLFPLVDPVGTDWEGGWLSQPLWYLRALLWLIIAAPLLRGALRRFGNAAFIVPVIAVFAIDVLVRSPQFGPSWFPSIRWYVGDFALYSIFMMVGFAHREGAFTAMASRVRAEWMMIAAGAAGIWCATQPMIGGVVNNSYPAHLLVGFAWLFAFLLAEPILRTVPDLPRVGIAVRWLTQRSLTVYLWHSTAIVIAGWTVDRAFPNGPRWLILPVLGVLIPMLTVLTGWAEDLAASRPMRIWPVGNVDASIRSNVERIMGRTTGSSRRRRRLGLGRTRPAFAITGVVALSSIMIGSQLAGQTAVLSAASGAESNQGAGEATISARKQSAHRQSNGAQVVPKLAKHRRPAPSARPETAVFALTDEKDPVGATNQKPSLPVASPTVPSTNPIDRAPLKSNDSPGSVSENLQSVVDQWRTDLGIEGTTIAIRFPDGSEWNAGSGTMAADEVVEVTSVTKSFTAALILRLVDKHLIDLDAPVPPLQKVPNFPLAAGITPRQLLNHTSGLATYQDSPELAKNPAMTVTPEVAARLAAAQPLLWSPGKNSGYSSSGYITLGILAEQAGGASLDEQFQREFFGPLGLESAKVDALGPVAGWIGWSTAGLSINMTDLSKWGVSLLRDQTVLSASSSAAMVNIDNEWSVGLGAWPLCPCSKDATGKKVYTSIGHSGGSGSFEYSPSDGLVIASFLTEPFFNGRITQQDLNGLLAQLRTAIASATPQSTTTVVPAASLLKP
jgi:CubicO group peptidase (beta-lactamase class C family)/peptidoglycan/LPS O-acetylase OafA/YrhL